jgi:hypothetical protein
MPSRATAKKESSSPASAPANAGSLKRTLLPAVPILIAALHSGLSSNPVSPPAPAPIAAVSSSITVNAGPAPLPLLSKDHPVDWWFVFKLNAAKFPKCGGPDSERACVFDDASISPPNYSTATGQRYLVASNEAPALVDGGPQCLGDSTSDPVGATFDEVYRGGFHYLIWNDQFHDVSPSVLGCSKGDCGAPWGHSKGMLAWNDAGDGFVMQVSTPSWPNAGNPKFHQAVGNTLGCIQGDNNVGVSQHFFALRLTKADLMKVLTGLQEASVATDPANPQVANIGGPPDVVNMINTLQLGIKSKQATLDPAMPLSLSSGVKLIVKPSNLNVPPWQMVSSLLGGVSLRTATWWAVPLIPSTTGGSVPGCWDASIPGKPGAVDIAVSGTWHDTVFSLKESPGSDGNHAKIGVSTSGMLPYAIFGDENQQGSLNGPDGTCDSSQNGRGGMFFVMDNLTLHGSMTALMKGASAPIEAPQ